MRSVCRRLALASTLVLVAGVPTRAQQAVGSDRQVVLPADNGLVVGHRARHGRSLLVELVPNGDTVTRYSRMVTLRTLPGLGQVPEGEVIDRFVALYRATCPRGTVAQFGVENGFKGIRIDCPLHPVTQTMETVFARVVDLAPDRAMVQVTLRAVPMPEDSRWARDYLSRVTVR